MKLRVDQVQHARDALSRLPDAPAQPREFVNAREAVALMADVLADLQLRGYTTGMIAELLSAQGIDISLPTLRQYLSETGNRTAAKKGKKTGKAGASAESATAKRMQKSVTQEPGPVRPAPPPGGGFAVRGDTEEL